MELTKHVRAKALLNAQVSRSPGFAYVKVSRPAYNLNGTVQLPTCLHGMTACHSHSTGAPGQVVDDKCTRGNPTFSQGVRRLRGRMCKRRPVTRCTVCWAHRTRHNCSPVLDEPHVTSVSETVLRTPRKVCANPPAAEELAGATGPAGGAMVVFERAHRRVLNLK